MELKQNLTSAEIANIWRAYQNASITSAVLKYFTSKVEDEEIKPVIQDALTLEQTQLDKLTRIFKKENFPIPIAFTDQDVNVEAPRLYTDNFFLQYVVQMGSLGMGSFTQAISASTREDIYLFFSEGFRQYNELHQKASLIALTKGLMNKPPIIPVPKEVDFVKKQSFLTGWFGERRPLTALEIANLYTNIARNNLGVATLTGFSQVAKSKEVTEYIKRGIHIAKKHAEVFSSVLREGDVPVPSGSDAMVTDANETSPFSDKLMMMHVTAMIGLGISFYGMSISTNIRRDLITHYTRLSGEIALYSEDGTNIMIDNGWLEEPPRMVARDDLVNSKK
ncbi:DUF3231 family protein [Virgibacillus dakarensis]|uniref:DUF3231 family protein n=1 Tax=Lentibacillus populi TaxID=1827502 RepID=A0A9W5TXI9_9BACI|nr:MULTISPECIES: DUF3231 family protein [Bacillaceae]MTW87128.1 DUF3231 family protein [Virgibacillus dakarensis]GGB41976.1 hypothetical protein GCM10011409_19420 [Lentibacillus populi]